MLEIKRLKKIFFSILPSFALVVNDMFNERKFFIYFSEYNIAKTS